ncbi:M48 family metallopeptidase [Echinicola vietnamensis]|uniref:Zn-dependent protease with chaperone function n=1 Tax=Echinicola vietnamensis (strain DSM 17526 / LMG 23754 / KMM 6221) TaxID=926556 RepID=L0FUC8_ECHVK|nr:M48 family metallopeptidase [Echinicola vietnamensis]AGA76623.1 Zn-dependent protease with chaperone function [Echinicola vietnamensis DSM 17526]
MNAEQLKYLLIGLVVAGFLFDKWTSWLNVRQPVPPVPDTLRGHLSQEKLQESKNYQRTNYRFGLLTSGLSFLVTVACLQWGVFGWLDAWVSTGVAAPLWQSLLFFGILFLASDLLSLPFDYYHTFKIEADFGFNKTTKKTFVLDKLKGYALGIILGGGLLALLLWLINGLGSGFWWYFWAVAAFFMVLINLFYTSWILPLFNKLTPLEEGPLKKSILAYASSVGFSLDNVFVIDGSTRSTKANAFFSGMGKRKKVVLYDTLIAQHTTEELTAVLAHEIGHYKKKHILQSMVISVLQIGVMLFVLSLFVNSETISLALGGERVAVHLNLIGFVLLFSPISTLLGIGMNMLSRKNEFEADRYAKETYAAKPLAEGLKTLSVKTLTQINPHPLHVFVNYSHPPLMQRLEQLEN